MHKNKQDINRPTKFIYKVFSLQSLYMSPTVLI